jgi:hypothetical protein
MRPACAGVLLLLACGEVQSTRPPHDLYANPWSFVASGVRPTTGSAQPPRFSATDTVESAVSPSGSFRVHFTRAGTNAVPAADTDGNGTPDFVDAVAKSYDAVLTFYAAQGFRAPPDDSTVGSGNGGDGKFDVYLVDFGLSADGAYRLEDCFSAAQGCAGYMVQENDFVGYGYRNAQEGIDTVSSHEFFHAVQATYDPRQGSIAAEGSAVWATEQYKPALDDLESFSAGYLSRPDKTLTVDPIGPVQTYSYGASVFFQFLSERYTPATVRTLWEDVVPGARGVANPRWLTALDALLMREKQASFAQAFHDFTRWNLSTGVRAGGAATTYANAARYAPLAVQAQGLPAALQLRLQPATAQAISVTPGGRPRLAVRFVPALAAPVEGVEVTVASLSGSRITSLASSAGPLTFATAGSDSFLLALSDGRVTGAGQPGTWCVGSEAEVAECAGDAPPDAGSGDGGEPPDAGPLILEAVPPFLGPPTRGCSTGTGLAPFAALVWLLRRRFAWGAVIERGVRAVR